MQTITLTKDSFETLIRLAFSDGKLYRNISPELYLSQFYEENQGIFKANKTLLKPVGKFCDENGTEIPNQ